jgi:hypothetical protein
MMRVASIREPSLFACRVFEVYLIDMTESSNTHHFPRPAQCSQAALARARSLVRSELPARLELILW